MPQGSPSLQLLRGLTKAELQAIPDRCDWCRVRETDVSANELSKKIRDSIERNASKDNITYSEAIRDIRNQVILPGPESITQKIRGTLRETPVARSVGGGNDGTARESWYTAQLYGALSNAIIRQYTVKVEFELNHRDRPTPDIYVASDTNRGDHVIEIKRAASNLNASEIGRQLKKYHRAIRNEQGRTRERSFLCIVGEDTDLDTIDDSRKSRPLNEYMDVPETIGELEDNLNRVDVIGCTFN